MFDTISIRAGHSAIKIIQDEGLDLSRVKVLAGASGSAKFLVLTGIDRVLISLFKWKYRGQALYIFYRNMYNQLNKRKNKWENQ